MIAREIVKQWLVENGYDGLAGAKCGCEVDDLMTYECGGEVYDLITCDFRNCEAGHRVVCQSAECEASLHMWNPETGYIKCYYNIDDCVGSCIMPGYSTETTNKEGDANE